jgi:hypothetical protein
MPPPDGQTGLLRLCPAHARVVCPSSVPDPCTRLAGRGRGAVRDGRSHRSDAVRRLWRKPSDARCHRPPDLNTSLHPLRVSKCHGRPCQSDRPRHGADPSHIPRRTDADRANAGPASLCAASPRPTCNPRLKPSPFSPTRGYHETDPDRRICGPSGPARRRP